MNKLLLAGSALLCLATASAQGDLEGNLSGIKDYLLGKTDRLVAETAELGRLSEAYYALAEAENFDYATLHQSATVTPSAPATCTTCPVMAVARSCASAPNTSACSGEKRCPARSPS